jgi:Tol biopolymer transport system component
MRTNRSLGRALSVAVGVAVAAAVAVAPAAAAEGDLTLASTAQGGPKGDGSSFEPSLSSDGTRVAFHSYSSNLVEGDANGSYDVFVKDLVTGEVILASATQDGSQGNGNSLYPSLSADGTSVTFSSEATNLAAGDTDTHTDIYVKDLDTGELTLATVDENGAKSNDGSNRPSISADGNRVAFWSYASNWVTGDTELTADVFVKDLSTDELILASADQQGAKGNQSSSSASLSADGTRVAFHSSATNLADDDTDTTQDVYVKDLLTGTVTLASTADNGDKSNRYSAYPKLSADGTRVAFESESTNLGEGDTDTTSDVFVKNLTTGELTLASADGNGTKGDGASRLPHLSADGSRVAFYTGATNLVPGDTDEIIDVLVKNLVTGALVLASTAENGTKGNAISYHPNLSADGTQVAFASAASNLGEGDTDPNIDVYVKTLEARVDPPPPVEPAPTCSGRTATVYVASGTVVGGPDSGQTYAGQLRGTEGPDVIVGTAQADSVLAAGGDDLVCALGGADTAYGGSGADQLLGEDGPDRLSGNNGRDTLTGGAGNDRLTGGTQADRFNGGAGRDTATDYRRAQGDTITAVP